MRIGLLSAEPDGQHGWSSYSRSLLAALRRAGIEVLAISPRGSTGEDPALLPVLIPSRPGLLGRSLLALPAVRRALAGCDLVHSTVEHYAPLAAAAAGGRPLFITLHGSYARLPQLRRWPVGALYARAYRRAGLICVSRYTAAVAAEVLPGLQPSVVSNGVDAERFAHLPALPPGEKRGPTVLAVGGIKRRKGTLELVRAMAHVRREVPDVQCVVLGRAAPEYLAQVQAAADELGLQDCVHMPGRVPDETLLAWYGAADLFVLPSINAGWKFEGFGLVHLEASAAGLPVIGTSGCGVEDAIDDGRTGLLVPQESLEQALPAAILSLLRDPARAAAMGAAGREKARAQSWDHVAAQVIALYEAALRSR